ncbi:MULTISPECIES: NAD-dependent epimerase/dehydratase family protein [Phenylobacterium]|uniref:Nucleoside-diphosphate-sugar epimerase n=1 Tax=Phenylobacterium koreense TaxID=266125 RepID=A0ABV2EJG9_9CAUL
MTGYTVIGARGFIGSRLVKALRARGDEVFEPGRDDPDLLSRELGAVFYCAGLTGDFATRPFDTVEAHVGLLTRLLRSGRFERLVYLSSTRVYDSLGAEGGRESDELRFDVAAPRNVYDLSKALGENLTLARSEGRGSVARLANVFDWADEAGGFLSDLLKRARGEREIVLASSPEAGRDYIHVNDVIAALVAMDDQRAGGIVNVASGVTVSNGQIAEAMAKAGWRLSLTGQGIAHGPVCDTSRLRALGVAPRDPLVVIEEALRTPGFLRA